MSSLEVVAIPAVTAAQGLACSTALRRGGMLGVDAFVAACNATKSPDRTCMPWRAADALVAANIDPYKLDYTLSSIMRYIGISLYREDTSKAILNSHLRDIYLRVRSRRPRMFTPVTDVLRAAIRAMVRHKLPLTADAVLPHLNEELRELWVGFMVAPPIVRAMRTLLAIPVMAAIVLGMAWYCATTVSLPPHIARSLVPVCVQLFVAAQLVAFTVCLVRMGMQALRCRGPFRRVIRAFPGAAASIAVLVAFLT